MKLSRGRLLIAGAAIAAAPGVFAADPSPVQELYTAKCQQCHMADGKSPLAPMDFTDRAWQHGSTPAAVSKVIAEGVPGTAMLPFKNILTPKEISSLTAYVRAFDPALKGKRAAKKK